MSSRVDKGPVHVAVAMSPAVWDGLCVLAARSGELPGAWMQRALQGQVQAELANLPDRVAVPGDDPQGDGYALGV